MSLTTKAMELANKYYKNKTLKHAIRVAEYACKIPFIVNLDEDFTYALAIAHDLLEDTKCPAKEFDSFGHVFCSSLTLLTKGKNEEYIPYIEKIRKHAKNYPSAYIVKLADIKDHLAQTDTLTDKLKEKYLEALPYLL